MSDLSSTPTGVHAKKKPLAKPVFASPAQIEEGAEGKEASAASLLAKHGFNEDLEKAKEAFKREEHEKRVKGLRKELDHLAKTNWQYEPVESLPGH